MGYEMTRNERNGMSLSSCFLECGSQRRALRILSEVEQNSPEAVPTGGKRDKKNQNPTL